MVAGGIHISRGLIGSDLCFEKKHHLGCLRGQRMDGEEAVDVAGPARLLNWSGWEIRGTGTSCGSGGAAEGVLVLEVWLTSLVSEISELWSTARSSRLPPCLPAQGNRGSEIGTAGSHPVLCCRRMQYNFKKTVGAGRSFRNQLSNSYIFIDKETEAPRVEIFRGQRPPRELIN